MGNCGGKRRDSARQGRINKRKGSDAEREYAKLFRELGFSFCQTSRYGSRIHDDAGIDLINLPINVQIKAGRQRGLNIPKLLMELKNRIFNMFLPSAKEQDAPLIIIHHREGKQGVPRTEFDSIVSMTFEDFCKLIQQIEWKD